MVSGAGYHSSVKRRPTQDTREDPAQQDAASQYSRPSKSQLKRDMTALQDLGEELLRLQPSKLRALPIPDALRVAVELAQKINAREGLRRQRQYIGRLMREIDADEVRRALDKDGQGHRAEVVLMHSAERWRARLLAEPDALEEFRQRHGDPGPGFAQLIAQAKGETGQASSGEGEGAGGRRYRELYRRLRELLVPQETAASDKPDAADTSDNPDTPS